MVRIRVYVQRLLCLLFEFDIYYGILGRQKRFSVAGTNWTKHQLTYRFHNYATKSVLTPAKQREIMGRAFNMWQAIGPLSFTDITDSASSADITIS